VALGDRAVEFSIAMPAGPTFCHTDDLQCFSLLYDIETFLRTIVRWELRGRNPKDWLGLISQDIKAAADSRFNQEREIAYLDIRHSGWLSYLTLPELKDLILDPLWIAFKRDWPPQDILQSEFKKLIAIRNKIAHFRPSTERDRRIVKRFAEDLTDWTAHYQKTRERQEIATFDDVNSERLFEAKKADKIKDCWNDLLRNGSAKDYSASIAFVGHHIALSLSVKAGSINPLEFIRFTEEHEEILSFCRIGDLGDKLVLYIPRKAEEEKTVAAFKDMLSVVENTVDGLSSEEVRIQFEFAQREGILPWVLNVPPDFSL
jgi:hypothetical protein